MLPGHGSESILLQLKICEVEELDKIVSIWPLVLVVPGEMALELVVWA